MKLIVRADDFGYTSAFNAGVVKSVEEGIVTHLEIMLDTPGSIEAMELVRKYPWLSLGWHDHFWGRPVSDPKEVPSLVNTEGRFKWRQDKFSINEIDYEECLHEMRAQFEKCLCIAGKVPDVCYNVGGNNPFQRAKKAVCDEYHVRYGFTRGYGRTGLHDGPVHTPEWKEQYANLNIRFDIIPPKGRGQLNPEIQYFFEEYAPEKRIMATDVQKHEQDVAVFACHPGYLDDYILKESSCTLSRPRDVQALTDPKLKQWLIENRVELVNTRDALYGTNEYQNHLRSINSPLWIGNFTR